MFRLLSYRFKYVPDILIDINYVSNIVLLLSVIFQFVLSIRRY